MKLGKYFSAHRGYPFGLLLCHMMRTGYELRGHVLQIGPIALCLVWRDREATR